MDEADLNARQVMGSNVDNDKRVEIARNCVLGQGAAWSKSKSFVLEPKREM